MTLMRAIGIPVWQDLNDKQAEQFVTLLDNTPADPGFFLDLCTAAQAISACGLVGITIARWYQVGNVHGSGSYPTVKDKVCFVCRAEDGSRTRFQLSGPIDGIFLDDHSTVDMENPLVVALVAQLKRSAATSAGSAIVEVDRGYRMKLSNGPPIW